MGPIESYAIIISSCTTHAHLVNLRKITLPYCELDFKWHGWLEQNNKAALFTVYMIHGLILRQYYVSHAQYVWNMEQNIFLCY